MAGIAADAVRVDPVWGALAGGAIAVAGASAWLAKRLLDLADVKRGQHREVYDLQNLAK